MTGHEEYDLTEDKKLIDYLTARRGQCPELTSDHIVPQKYAYDHGGNYWTISKMIEFEYSLDNEVITKGATNNSKKDRGPSERLPILGKDNYSPQNYEQLILSQQDPVIEIIEDYCFTWDKVSKRYGIQLEDADRNIIQFVISSATKRGRNPRRINPHYYRGGRRLVWPY